ncbi:MAG: SpoIIE family protein phosphatase, partial [Calothrix sp. SM1_7_51]|nr:SpoIIE family protein phosphatase [Calothrix sp. SM1_7_51]
KIVAKIGESFETTFCLLKPVEGESLSPDNFFYQDPNTSFENYCIDPIPLIQKVLETHQYHINQGIEDNKPFGELVVPLTYQQKLQAVLALYQRGSSQVWDDEDIQLIAGVAEQAALALSQAKLYQRLQEKQEQIRIELEVARQIQNNLLRQNLPDIKEAKVQASCFPAREVGGDFFEVFAHPRGELWLAVGDVSGKGVPAALFMASAISVLRRELSQETPAEPNIVMQNLNHALSDDLISNNCFITLVLARYTPTTKELVCANAGHIYPLLWSQKDAANPNYLKVRGIPLGIKVQWQANSERLLLSSGDILLLASDGITEAKVLEDTANNAKFEGGVMLSNHPMLNQEGLWRLLQSEAQPLCLSNLLARIQAGSQVQEDDQTILSLEVL